jgi:hypothetical protein
MRILLTRRMSKKRDSCLSQNGGQTNLPAGCVGSVDMGGEMRETKRLLGDCGESGMYVRGEAKYGRTGNG